jgi:hypothetical protein
MTLRSVHTCTQCDLTIQDGEGYICVSERDAIQYLADLKTAEREALAKGGDGFSYALSDFQPASKAAKWRAYHGGCDPRPDAADYWIAVERARTAEQLLDWTLHLTGKTWFDGTDWDRYVRRTLPAGALNA